MKLREKECYWCEKMYVYKDSKANNPTLYCSKRCEAEKDQADDDCGKWVDEIEYAWAQYESDYEPEEDEVNPHDFSDCCRRCPSSRRKYEAFQERYRAWKRNHCWKKSFWEWDEFTSSSCSGGVSGGRSTRSGGGSGSGGGGIGKVILNLVIVAVVVWLGWKGIKGVWNWMFSDGGEVDIMATITESWEKHLDQRREAFEDGLSENEVEAKGLRNYTLAEWEEKCLKEQEAKKQEAMKQAAEEGEKEKDSATQKAKDIGKEALSTVKGLGSKAKGFLHKITE